MLDGLITKAALRWIKDPRPALMRCWLRCHPEQAERRFKGLRAALGGLREQATVGEVREDHRAAVAWALACLDVWPQGIRGERAGEMIGPEAGYLELCTEADFGLKMARKKFLWDAPQEWERPPDAGGEYLQDTLGGQIR